MSEILDQIYHEITQIGEAADKLRGTVHGAVRQTDLEVAILTQQIADLRDKNARASAFIQESLSILHKLRGNMPNAGPAHSGGLS